MFETFHQSPHGDFKPTFYNPFEIKHRRRTTKAQYRVLEEAYQENNKPSASARKQIATRLGMTARAVQVWFQNRRAKDKSGNSGTAGVHGRGMASIACGGNGGCSTDQETGTLILDEDLSESHRLTTAPTERGRKRLGSASAESLTGSSLSLFGAPSSNGMARRHSMPDMNPLAKAGQLPFKELHEAIFGKQQVSSQNPSTYYHAISRPILAPTPIPIAPFPTPGQTLSSHGQQQHQHQQHHIPIMSSTPSAAALEMAMAASLGQSDSLRPLLRKNPAIANLFAYYLNAGQLAGPVSGDGSNDQLAAGSVDGTGGVNPMNVLGDGSSPSDDTNFQSPLLSHDPMISGEGSTSRKITRRQTVSATTAALPIQDMATPSISAPESSPTLTSEDIYQQLRDLMQLGQQPPNTSLIESVANDLAHHFSPAQLDVLLEEECSAGGVSSCAEGKGPITGCGKLDNMDLFAHSNDFGTDAIFAAGDQFYNFPPDYGSADTLPTGRF